MKILHQLKYIAITNHLPAGSCRLKPQQALNSLGSPTFSISNYRNTTPAIPQLQWTLTSKTCISSCLDAEANTKRRETAWVSRGFWVTPGCRASKKLVVGDRCNHLMTTEVWTEIHLYRGRYQSWRQPPEVHSVMFVRSEITTKLKQVTPFGDDMSQRKHWMRFRICFFSTWQQEIIPLPLQVHQWGLN